MLCSRAMEAHRVREMFGAIAGRYDLANSVLSLGIHHSWRKSLLKLLPQSSTDKNSSVLDLCTGTGDLLPLLRARFGKVYGADFCLPMLSLAASKEEKHQFLQPRLIQADALRMPFHDNIFDVVTVAFGVRNFEDTEKGLKEISRIIRPGGAILVLEFGQPNIPLFSQLYNFYSRFFMPLLGGLLTGKKEAYRYLPETSRAFPCRNKFCEKLNNNGFESASYRSLTLGIAYAYIAYRRS